MFLPLASVRLDIGNYVAALFEVYIALILIYVLSQLLFSFGVRPSYSRFVDALLGFLRDVSEPWLRIFRRLVPSLGPLDLSPTVAIIALIVIAEVVVRLIKG